MDNIAFSDDVKRYRIKLEEVKEGIERILLGVIGITVLLRIFLIG